VSDRPTHPGAWPVLLVFTLAAGVTQLLWLNFAPLISLVEARYHVSELMASTLILVFPLLYVFLSLHAGAMIDRRGFRVTVGAGALVTALFSFLRIFDQSFFILLLAQIGIAAAQPYVVNGISKLVADWFAERQGAVATGVGTMGMFVGMAVGMAWTPSLVDSTSLRTAMIVFALIASVAAVLFLLLAREAPGASYGVSVSSRGFLDLIRERDLALVFGLSFLGLGFFNGLTTWLEQIVAPNGISSEQAGLIGGALIVGGIVGAGAIPALSDLVGRRKPFVVGCAAAASITVYPLCTGHSFTWLMALGAATGLFFLPAYALLLEMCSELAGPASAGYATGLLMLMGNAGGVVVIVAMPLVKGDGPSYLPAVWLMLGLLVLAVLLALMVGETFHHKARSSKEMTVS
jgi:MFS family permease